MEKELNKLQNVNVVELDDIDDENALELLEKQWMGVDKFNKMKDKMNSISIMNIYIPILHIKTLK